MFKNTISSIYLRSCAWEICAKFGDPEEVRTLFESPGLFKSQVFYHMQLLTGSKIAGNSNWDMIFTSRYLEVI